MLLFRHQIHRIVLQRPIGGYAEIVADNSARRGIRLEADLDGKRPARPLEPGAISLVEGSVVHLPDSTLIRQAERDAASRLFCNVLRRAAMHHAVRRARVAVVVRIAVSCGNLREPVRRSGRDRLRALVDAIVVVHRRPDLSRDVHQRHGAIVARHRTRVRHAVEHLVLRKCRVVVVLENAIVNAQWRRTACRRDARLAVHDRTVHDVTYVAEHASC